MKWKRVVETMRCEHDRWRHIFVSRRHYRNVHDTKGGKRRETDARLNLGEYSNNITGRGDGGTPIVVAAYISR